MKAGKPIDVPLGANQQFYKRIYSKWLHLKGDNCNEFSVGFLHTVARRWLRHPRVVNEEHLCMIKVGPFDYSWFK